MTDRAGAGSPPAPDAPAPDPSAQPAPGAERTPAFELLGISKRFGDVVANDDVSLRVLPAEAHAVLGENGAGKTTLMRILYGLTVPDAGEIRVGGRRVTIGAPRDAIASGIGMVTQHFSLILPMTVAENVALGDAGGFRLDRRRAAARVRETSERLGIKVDPDARVERLSVGERQRVEILKALSRDCRILVLDEPTAVLVPQEVEALFATLRRLRGQGLAIVFISHKLHEVTALADRVTVLRRGRVVATLGAGEADERQLAQLMVGRPTHDVSLPDAALAPPTATTAPEPAPPVLEVAALRIAGRGRAALGGVSFEVRGGEIVGVAGVSGNGQSELVAALSGTLAPDGGSIRVGGIELAGRGVRATVEAGVGRIAEDRHASIVGDLSVAENLVLEELDAYAPRGVLDRAGMERHANDLIERFAIRARPADRIRTLSGGNIQKVLLARVLSRDPRVLVVSQPTRGLDVGATEYVREALLARRAAGAAVLLVSEDLDELLALSDRLLVLFEGRVIAEVARAEATPERVGLLMAGHARAAPAHTAA